MILKTQTKLLYKSCKFYKLSPYNFITWLKNANTSYIYNMMQSKFQKNQVSKIYFIDNIRIRKDLHCQGISFEDGYVNHVKNMHDVLKTFEMMDEKKKIYIDDLKNHEGL